MGTRERFYISETIDCFQELNFGVVNNIPVELEVINPVEYGIDKGQNFHTVRIVIDKALFTEIAKSWLKNLEEEQAYDT